MLALADEQRAIQGPTQHAQGRSAQPSFSWRCPPRVASPTNLRPRCLLQLKREVLQDLKSIFQALK